MRENFEKFAKIMFVLVRIVLLVCSLVLFYMAVLYKDAILAIVGLIIWLAIYVIYKANVKVLENIT